MQHPDSAIDQFRTVLRRRHRICVPIKMGDIEGRLLVQHPKAWNPDYVKGDAPVLMVAMEKGGCAFINGREEVSIFPLLSAGFNIFVARAACDFLKELFTQVPKLSYPKNTKRPQAKAKNTRFKHAQIIDVA